MKKIYYLHVHMYDYCSNWEHDILHTFNKKQLESLKLRLEKKYKRPEYSFSVKELVVNKDSLCHEDIKQELSYLGID